MADDEIIQAVDDNVEGIAGFIKALWRGERSLAFTFWVMGVFGTILLTVIHNQLKMSGYYDVSNYRAGYMIAVKNLPIIVLFIEAWILYSCFILISIWKSSDKYNDKAKTDEKHSIFWGYAASVITVFGWLALLTQIGQLFK